jgi:hypothetical protein
MPAALLLLLLAPSPDPPPRLVYDVAELTPVAAQRLAGKLVLVRVTVGGVAWPWPVDGYWLCDLDPAGEVHRSILLLREPAGGARLVPARVQLLHHPASVIDGRMFPGFSEISIVEEPGPDVAPPGPDR